MGTTSKAEHPSQGRDGAAYKAELDSYLPVSILRTMLLGLTPPQGRSFPSDLTF